MCNDKGKMFRADNRTDHHAQTTQTQYDVLEAGRGKGLSGSLGGDPDHDSVVVIGVSRGRR